MANATVTVESSGGDYTSLNAALAGEAADLTSNCGGTGGAGILTIQCGNFEDTTTATTGTGYTTSSSYYINIIGDPADKSSTTTGKWSTSRYRLVGTGNPMLTLSEPSTVMTDLQLYTTGNTGLRIVESAFVDRCIVARAGRNGFSVETSVTIRNSIAYDCGRNGFTMAGSGTLTAQNCTAIDCTQSGFTAGASGQNMTCTNCLAWDCGDGATYWDFGTIGGTLTLNYCLSKDTTADNYSGTGNVANSTNDPFVNYAADDFHLAVGSAPIGAGSDLSGTFTIDIDGDTRSAWDIGADEYVAAATGIPRSNPFSRPFRQAFGRGGL